MAVVIIEKKVILDSEAHGNCKALWDITTGKPYVSEKVAAKEIGCTISAISHSMREGTNIIKGHHLCWLEEMPLHVTEIADAISKRDAKLQSIKALLN